MVFSRRYNKRGAELKMFVSDNDYSLRRRHADVEGEGQLGQGLQPEGKSQLPRRTLFSRTGCLYCLHVVSLLPKRHVAVTLSEAKSLLRRQEILRFAQNDN